MKLSKNNDWWRKFRSSKSTRLTNEEYKKICEIYSIEFSKPYKEPCTCSPKGIQKYIDAINKKYLNGN